MNLKETAKDGLLFPEEPDDQAENNDDDHVQNQVQRHENYPPFLKKDAVRGRSVYPRPMIND
jgi:hypothetical protein